MVPCASLPLTVVEILLLCILAKLIFRPRIIACVLPLLMAAIPFVVPAQSFTDIYSPSLIFAPRIPVAPELIKLGPFPAVLYTPGGMALGQVDMPTHLAQGEVLIEVHAASINPVDWKLGKQIPFLRLFKTVGIDVSGVVRQSASPLFVVGDAVFGSAEWGSLRYFAVARDHLLLSKPAQLSHAQAAALVMGFKTSFEALVERARVKAGERVLVLGGAGGCGAFGVQIAHAVGAEAFATSSQKKAAFVRHMGANVVWAYDAHPVVKPWLASVEAEGALGTFDVVYDTVGDARSKAQAARALKPGGRFVTIAQPVWPLIDAWRFPQMNLQKFTMRFGADNLGFAVDLLRQGRLSMEGVVQREFALAEFAEAFALLKTQRVQGKLVFVLKLE